MAKYYIIAGEASGDLHAAKLVEQLKEQDSQAEIRAWGGDEMQKAGAKLEKHIEDLAFMGFLEVLANLPQILRNFADCKKNIVDFKPDALILVDYAGFNLKIAKFAKKKGIKVYFYISPKVWAWKKGRIKKLKAYTDRLFVIFPFEKDFFAKYNMKVDYVGNPLVERISSFHKDEDFLKKNELSDNFIALLPGSRKQEITKILPNMLALARQMRNQQFVIAASQNSKKIFEEFRLPPNVLIIYQATYNLLSYAKAAVVTSGTATLETALFNVPQVVVYNTSVISYWIASKVVDRSYLKHISLVNIIAQREVVKELIQRDFSIQKLGIELELLFNSEEYRQSIIQQYKDLSRLLGDLKSSEEIVKLIRKDLSSAK